MQTVDPTLSDVLDMIGHGRLETAVHLLDPAIGFVDDLDCDDLLDDLITLVKTRGWEFLGSGAYSLVFQIPGDPSAYKINYRKHDPMALYARYAIENSKSNPMLPVIYAAHFSDGYQVIRMELLKSANVTKSVGLSMYTRRLQTLRNEGNLSYRDVRRKIVNFIRTEFDFVASGIYDRSDLAKIVWWISGILGKSDLETEPHADFHGNNWMLRGNQLVVTDPLG